MPTASMFDDPVRERGRLGSIVAGMGDGTYAPTERVANAFLVTEAQEPNAITTDETGSQPVRSQAGPRGSLLPRGYPQTRDDEKRALVGTVLIEDPEMADLSRSDLVLTVMKEAKQCASCGRGSRLQFGYGHWLKWRRCRRDLTPAEKALLDANRPPYSEHCLSNLRDPGYE